MIFRYTTPNQRLTFEVDVPTVKIAFEVVAAIQELFEEEACGMCVKKWDKDAKRPLPNKGWYKWQPKGDAYE